MRLIAALVLAAVAAAAQNNTGAIEGVITDSATKQPVAGVRVSITPAGAAADLFTDASGGFHFGDLMPARYGVSIKLAGYRDSLRFVGLKGDGSAVQVAVQITPLSEIAGQVLDEDGHPVEGADLYIGISQRATTDAEGRYRITELAPGDYQLFCRPSAAWREGALQRNAKTGEALGYADAYYFPGVDDRSRAVKTTISAGVRLGGFDFRLHRTALVDFSGHVLDRDGGEPLTTAAVELESLTLGSFLLDETRDRRRVDRKGVFQFKLIPPGRYSLLVYRNGALDMNARPFNIPVDVGAAGVKDAELRVPRNLDLSVTITAPHPERTHAMVSVLVGPGFAAVLPHSSQISACRFGETCVVRDIPPGQWTINVQVPLDLSGQAAAAALTESGDPPHRLAIESVRLGQQNAWNNAVMVADGGNPPIEIVLTDKTGAISAAVSTEDGHPADAAVIVPRRLDGESAGLGSNRILHPTDGRFLLDGLVAGEYELAAFVSDNDTLLFTSSERCGDRAVKVRVTADQTTSVSLRPCMFQ